MILCLNIMKEKKIVDIYVLKSFIILLWISMLLIFGRFFNWKCRNFILYKNCLILSWFCSYFYFVKNKIKIKKSYYI